MGLDFFRRSVELQKKYQKPYRDREHVPDQRHPLNDEWCQFFHEHKFLIGLSTDGLKSFTTLIERTRRQEPL